MGEVMRAEGKINYIEMPSSDLAATKQFFSEVFGWGFVDYGTDYMAIEHAGIDGGFFLSDQAALTANGSVLAVLYSGQLEQTLEQVVAAGGRISKAVFSFPGGRRFHFCDPAGSEFAVWSE